MKPVTVFTKDKGIIHESEEWQHSRSIPDGAYVRDARYGNRTAWYRICHYKHGMSNAVGVDTVDLPKWVKAWLLILQ